MFADTTDRPTGSRDLTSSTSMDSGHTALYLLRKEAHEACQLWYATT